MSLDLVAMAADVEAIAEKATKEAHQENALTVLQATWERIEFSATASAETDTPLINMIEEDLEVRAGQKKPNVYQFAQMAMFREPNVPVHCLRRALCDNDESRRDHLLHLPRGSRLNFTSFSCMRRL